MRIPGLGGEVVKRMGATPVTKAGGEIFLALSQGNIDAAEWVGPWNDLAFGFQDIAKYYYYPGFHEPGPALAVGTNLAVWNDLDEWEQSVIKAAARAESTLMNSEYVINNARALSTLENEHGVHVLPFPDDVVTEMARLSQQVLEEASAEDELTGRIYDSFLAAKNEMARWSDVGIHAYLDARRRTLPDPTGGA